MFSKVFSAATVALAASTMVSAQTFTSCDPTKKDCPADPALGKSVSIDFTKGNNEDVFRKLEGTDVKFEDQGALFSISKETEAPTMASNKYIFFGKLEVVLKASPGQGVVTSVVLQSDDLDEIDWEWLGGDNVQVQTNYFGKGDTTTYDRGAYHPVDNPVGAFHTYTIDWNQDAVKWLIDGNVVRELKYADAKGGSRFPQTPMEVKIGTWVAGRKDAPKGTVEWAGGYTDFSKAPFNAYYKSITITDYQGGKTGAKSYVYGDRSGSWESIVVKTDGGDDEKSSSSSKSASKTDSKTTLTTVTSSGASSATATKDATATADATATGTGSSGSSSGASATGASSTTSAPATVVTGSGFMNQANLALGAAGLLFTFLL